jgi:hypothetical protein
MRVWFHFMPVLPSQYIYDHTLRYTTDLTAPIDNTERRKITWELFEKITEAK